MMRHLILLLLLLAISLQGCVMQTRRADTGGMTAYDGVSSDYPGDAQHLAGMAAGELARRYSPTSTTLILADSRTTFGQELEASLRRQGFAVSQVVTPNSVGVGFTLDVIRDLAPATCYLQVRTSDGQAFGQVRALSMTSLAQDHFHDEVPSTLLEASLPPEGPATIPAPAHPAQTTVGPESEAGGKPAQEPAAPASRSAGTPVRSKATAAHIAKRNKISVADFCRWNDVSPKTVLEADRLVHLHDPGPGTGEAAKPAATALYKERLPKQLPHLPHAAPPPAANQKPAPGPASNPAPTPAPATAPASPASAPAPASTSAPTPGPASAPASAPSDSVSTPASSAASTAPEVREALAEITPDAPPSPPTPSWTINPGSLQAQLSAWATRAQYQLIWKAKNDFNLEASAHFEGEFIEAVKLLISGMHQGGNPLRVTIYQGNNVVEVAED